MKVNITLPLTFAFCCICLLLSGCVKPPATDAVPRLVLVVDESASFQKNLPIVANLVTRFIKQEALVGNSDIYIITMDRQPRVLHMFKAAEVMKKGDQEILARLSETCPQDGTDVVGALQLAVNKLNEDPVDEYAKIGPRYLEVYSDMQVDNGHNPSVTFNALNQFDWNGVKDCAKVRFYFVDDDQKTDMSQPLRAMLQKAGVDSERYKILGPEASRKASVSDILE